MRTIWSNQLVTHILTLILFKHFLIKTLVTNQIKKFRRLIERSSRGYKSRNLRVNLKSCSFLIAAKFLCHCYAKRNDNDGDDGIKLISKTIKQLTAQDMDEYRSRVCVRRRAGVPPGVGGLSALHQQVRRGRLSLLRDDWHTATRGVVVDLLVWNGERLMGIFVMDFWYSASLRLIMTGKVNKNFKLSDILRWTDLVIDVQYFYKLWSVFNFHTMPSSLHLAKLI